MLPPFATFICLLLNPSVAVEADDETSLFYLTPSDDLATALAQAEEGDVLMLREGVYPQKTISNVAFNRQVTVAAAPDAAVTLTGLDLRNSHHLTFVGIKFSSRVRLESCSFLNFERVILDAGEVEQPSLLINGQGKNGPCHHIVVTDSRIRGGKRTVFILGGFAPSVTWNHHIVFRDNEFVAGSFAALQISGGRDILIEGNRFATTRGTCILTAGCQDLEISRNRFDGQRMGGRTAISLSTPGREFDPFAGVRHMTTSKVVVANNLIQDFLWAGIALQGTHDINIVHNTIVGEGASVFTRYREPRSFDGRQTILAGNTSVRIWNNIFSTMEIDPLDERPEFEHSNLVTGNGGGGINLIKSDPAFEDAIDYRLSGSSPALGQGNPAPAHTPRVDFRGRERSATAPDLGAWER